MVTKKKISSTVFILLAFLLWQSTLIVITPFASKFLPARERFMYSEDSKFTNPKYFWNRANFDGNHYLIVSRNGYDVSRLIIFPFYPKLINFLSPFFSGKDLIASIFISNIAFLISIFIFYKLIKLDFSESIAKNSILFLFLFPTSFIFGMTYTEGIFLLLLIGSFYSARRGRWFLAGILGGIASYTRLEGIFIFPALFFEWFEQAKSESVSEKIKKFLPTLLVFVGLFVYMRYLSINFNDPFKFLHTKPFFGVENTTNKIILIYQVFYRYFKMVITTKFDPLYFTVWLELISAVGFIFLLITAFIKKMRLSYLVFSLLAFIVPTLSGSFSSLPRYVLTMFPCFICFGLIKNKTLKISLAVILGVLMLISTAFFYRGYWIS